MEAIRVVEPVRTIAPGWRVQLRRALDDCWSAGQMVIAFLVAAVVFGPNQAPVAPIFTPGVATFGAAVPHAAVEAEPAAPRVAVTVELKPQLPQDPPVTR